MKEKLLKDHIYKNKWEIKACGLNEPGFIIQLCSPLLLLLLLFVLQF